MPMPIAVEERRLIIIHGMKLDSLVANVVIHAMSMQTSKETLLELVSRNWDDASERVAELVTKSFGQTANENS